MSGCWPLLPLFEYVCRLEVAHDNKKSHEQIEGFTYDLNVMDAASTSTKSQMMLSDKKAPVKTVAFLFFNVKPWLLAFREPGHKNEDLPLLLPLLSFCH